MHSIKIRRISNNIESAIKVRRTMPLRLSVQAPTKPDCFYLIKSFSNSIDRNIKMK
ncbi:hypothetical protein HMPREF9554_02074 [Treponema phagedenis F0421]|nr:hypothetical protein HMPREF9554_02074 [Treponema phagedenis F0421]